MTYPGAPAVMVVTLLVVLALGIGYMVVQSRKARGETTSMPEMPEGPQWDDPLPTDAQDRLLADPEGRADQKDESRTAHEDRR